MNYDALAGLYTLQYAHYRDDIGFYARLAERLGATRVLELGAGTGRVTVALARQGLTMTGLELSAQMLERGRHHATDEGVEIEWCAGDMRDFKLGRSWPLLIAPFNALMHLYTLDDQDRTLECVRQHLEPGGSFAFDLYQPHFGVQGVLRHEGETFFNAGSRTDVLLHQRVDTSAQLVTTTYFVDCTAADQRLTREVLELRQRYFTHFELERWFRTHGFRLELRGDFSGARLEANSPHFIGVARLA